MDGPDTDELVRTGKVLTPYQNTICSRKFPLRPRAELALGVLVPELKDVPGRSLALPTMEQAIRFASQVGAKDVHVGKTLIFPTDPPFPGDIEPHIPSWLALVWRERLMASELCLYHIARVAWPEHAMFVGFAVP